jgi:predicted transcriptional regulator
MALDLYKIVTFACKALGNASGVADALGVSRTAVSAWLRGTRMPDEDTIITLVRMASIVQPLVRVEALEYYRKRYESIEKEITKEWV